MSGDEWGDEPAPPRRLPPVRCAAPPAPPSHPQFRRVGVRPGAGRWRLQGHADGRRRALTPGPRDRCARSIRSMSVVEGRTLIVRANRSASWGGYPGESAGPVEVLIGTHELTAAFVNGAGSLAINKVRGLKFEASAQGAGAIAIDRGRGRPVPARPGRRGQRAAGGQGRQIDREGARHLGARRRRAGGQGCGDRRARAGDRQADRDRHRQGRCAGRGGGDADRQAVVHRHHQGIGQRQRRCR